MFRKTAGIVGIAVLAGAAPAYAASGSLTDPKGDFPDIVKLTYDNAASRVTMTMTYGGGRPQSESFYMRWGSEDRHYQVFASRSTGLKELRYSRAPSGGKVRCAGLVIRRPTARSTTAVIPRSCLPKAPARLRFQGVGTTGLMSLDETRRSAFVGRGRPRRVRQQPVLVTATSASPLPDRRGPQGTVGSMRLVGYGIERCRVG